MDPLSAFSVACGVVQFIDFASKLVSAGNEIYHAPDGVLVQNKAAEDVAEDLKSITQELSKTQSQWLVGQSLEPDELRLQIISDNCSKIATELTDRLDKLKIQGKNRRWRSYRQALMSVWQKDDIDKIAARLEQYHKVSFRLFSWQRGLFIRDRNLTPESCLACGNDSTMLIFRVASSTKHSICKRKKSYRQF
jgi:hypothetical protein